MIRTNLAPYRPTLATLAVEPTYNWYWLVDGLIEDGFDVRLANTTAIQQYDGLKYTNDLTDTRFLAQLLRLGILPQGYIYPPEERAVRDLFRRRLLLRHQRTMQHVSLQGLIARHCGRRLTALQIKRLTEADLKPFFQHAASLESARILRHQMQQLIESIQAIEKQVAAHCQSTPDYERITSIPGIGPILGHTILLETGPIDRFPTVGHYACYARCVPSVKLSNGERRGEGNRKNGNRYLAMAFVEAAHYAAIWNPAIQRFYQRRQNRVHKMVANKLAKACYHMLTRGERFDVTRAVGRCASLDPDGSLKQF